VAKTAPILGPLVGFGRGANLPYFNNQSENWAYSPQEQKRGDLWGFPVSVVISGEESEPVLGLFCLRIHTPRFQVSPKRDK
jgi:hypothetical protein